MSRRILRLLAVATLATVAGLGSAGVASAAPSAPAHTGTADAFVLLTPNRAVAPSAGMMAQAGDWISVTGDGTFDPATGTVRAGGAFVHYRADGTVHCRGTWSATALTGWAPFGTGGGVLRQGTVSMLVTHYCPAMGETHTGIPMTVTAAAPSTSTAIVGITVGEFSVPVGGRVAIVSLAR